MLDYNSVSPIQTKDMKTPCRMVTLRPDGSEIIPAGGILYQRPTDKTVKFRYHRIDI